MFLYLRYLIHLIFKLSNYKTFIKFSGMVMIRLYMDYRLIGCQTIIHNDMIINIELDLQWKQTSRSIYSI